MLKHFCKYPYFDIFDKNSKYACYLRKHSFGKYQMAVNKNN